MNAASTAAAAALFVAVASIAVKNAVDLLCGSRRRSAALELATRSLHAEGRVAHVVRCGGRARLVARRGRVWLDGRELLRLEGGLHGR